MIDGWRVVRSQRSVFVDPAKVRRRTVVALLVAVAVGAVLTIGAVGSDWIDVSPARAVVACALIAGGVGCSAGVFIRTGRSDAVPVGDRPLGDWRRSDRIDQQFSAHPPTPSPEDRDVVLERAHRMIALGVVAVDRSVVPLIGFVLVWAGLLVAGLAAPEYAFVAVYPALLLVTPVGSLLQVARADAARQRALGLPAPPAHEPPRPRSRDDDRPGSKLSLPDE